MSYVNSLKELVHEQCIGNLFHGIDISQVSLVGEVDPG